MNVTLLSTNLSPLLDHMKTEGYSARKMHFVKKMAKEIVKLSHLLLLSSYDDYFERFVKPKYPTRSEKNKAMHKHLVHILEEYAEHGILPNENKRPSAFMAYCDRIPKDSEFTKVINLSRNKFSERNLDNNTINVYTKGLGSFFYYQYRNGNTQLCKITEKSTLAYFNDEEAHRGYSQMAHIRTCLLEVQCDYPICKQILVYLPKLNPRKKVYPYLRDSEFKLILSYVMDTTNIMSYRDRAIMILAMFTGLRGCDIAQLKFSDIDWKHGTICICQKKTGREVSLPLRPIIGNAIWDYLQYERQTFRSEYVFLSNFGKVKPITHSAIQHLVEALFERVNLRQDGTRIGLHLFRHNLATQLLADGISVPIISDVLGHESLESLDTYISAEHKHLKECALSIEGFPVREGVLSV